MSEQHTPDPEFVEYLRDVVNNPFLSAHTVLRMERVFIDQRNKYEAKLEFDRMVARTWEMTMMEVIGEDGPASVADAIRKLQDQAAKVPASGEMEPVAWANVLEWMEPPLIYPFAYKAQAEAAADRNSGTVRPLIFGDTHPPAKVPEGIIQQCEAAINDAAERCGGTLNGVRAAQKKVRELLTTPTPATTPETEWVKCHAETAAIALEALHFYAAERFKGFGDDPEPYEHHLAQQAISELQGILPAPPQEQ